MKALLVLLCSAVIAQSQTSVSTTAGGDQIYNAYGIQTAFTWHNLSGWTGIGCNNGVKVGGYLRVPLHRTEAKQSSESHLDLGDQIISAGLDTDDFGGHSFSVRGAGISHNTKTSHSQLFGGLLLEESMLPYMHTGSTVQTPLVVMNLSRQLTKTLQTHTLNTFDGKITSIESFSWKPTKSWILSGAGGVGAGSGYGAVAGEYLQKRMDLRTSYTVAGSKFQRQETPYYSQEALGLNARASFSPIDAVNINYSHDNSRTSIVGYPSITGVSDSGSVSAAGAGFTVNTSAGTSTIVGMIGQTKSESISVSRAITSRWRAFGSFINMDSPLFKEQVEIAVNEFKISSRLTVTQDFNRMNGQNTFSFGGHWVSNRISLSAEQQTYISPIAVALGGKPIFQAWTFGIRLRMPHGATTNLTTIVDPTGKVQLGGYLSGLRYSSIGPEHDDSPSFSKYSVQGVVNDEAGKGVAGIAIQIGKETVLSNESGVFYLDVKSRKLVPMRVVKELSVQPLRWELTSAPSAAQGTTEDAAVPVHVVVQMTSSLVASGTK